MAYCHSEYDWHPTFVLIFDTFLRSPAPTRENLREHVVRV
jgi:hypothetical protein